MDQLEHRFPKEAVNFTEWDKNKKKFEIIKFETNEKFIDHMTKKEA
jgi:hypothetical protein